MDGLQVNAAVEQTLPLVREMPQAIPLRRHLRVEGPHVIVDGAGRLVDEFLTEELPGEEGFRGLGVQGPVQGDSLLKSAWGGATAEGG